MGTQTLAQRPLGVGDPPVGVYNPYEPCGLKGIVTNPAGPAVNNELPVKKNTFNWHTGPLNNGTRWPLNSTWVPNMPSIALPWWQTDNVQISALQGYVDKPADGWELIKRDLGYDDTGAPASVTNPYVILYNKYTGMLRVFVAVAQIVPGYNFAEIKLSFVGGGAAKIAGTLNKMDGIGVALENTTPTLDNAFAAVSPFLNETGRWFMADFPMDYDPCACQFDSKLAVTVRLINNLDIQLSGVASGTLVTSNVATPGSTQTSSDFDSFGSAYKKTLSVAKSGQKSYKSLTDFASGAKKWLNIQPTNVGSAADTQAKKDAIDNLKNALAGSSFLRAGLSALPWIGTAVSVFDSFFGGGEEASPQPIAMQPMALEMSIKLSGTISASYLYKDITFNNPGRRATTATSEYPYYNEAMGVFSLLRKPVVRRKRVDARPNYPSGKATSYYYQVSEGLQYAINPAARLVVQDFKAAIIQECAVYPQVLPLGWVFEGQTAEGKYAFRTEYMDSWLVQCNSPELYTITGSSVGPYHIDIEGAAVYIKLMINFRRTSGSANAQNVLFVQKYPVTLVESVATMAVPWPSPPGALCDDLVLLPQITRTALQTFCTGSIYAAATTLPRSPVVQGPDTTIGKRATVPLEVGVYPNPANEQLSVRFVTGGATARVRLYDALGRVVYSSGIGAGNVEDLQQATIPLVNLTAGLYQCVVESAGRRQSRQVSVQH